ncbi:hypothetical protein O0L34_g9121 [Tuta absoluta]|nr:hypothetical protein O0L34_g9121 [Tuta absoluta]
MYHKIVWCYIIILTLLDISLNTKLTAQGKSHGAGISVHDSLVEGITFSEWGKDPPHGGGGDEGGGGGARAPVRLEPATLVFGARALGSAHAATVTLHNTGNTTLHLASVAGTTPDFHASFFDSKTLPPDGNTTFSVVYLGRREGPVSAHLYIHTALGVHKYSVSAEGVASEYDVWPLLGLRVPANVSLQPVLTLRNPTARPIQVTEVYSSGGWVRLSLPGGGASADKGAWLIPPHSTRPIVQLSISAPPHTHTPTAYIR